MLEYTYNTRRMETRTYTSYQIVYRETPEITTKKIIKEIQTQERQYDEMTKQKEENPAFQFKKNDWIYMKRKEDRKDRPSRSLDHKW